MQSSGSDGSTLDQGSNMLNLKLGEMRDVGGVPYLHVRRGEAGHPLYGPYEHRDAGAYEVAFPIRAAEDWHGPDAVCALVDVATDWGQTILAHRPVWASEIGDGAGPVRLAFELPEARNLEYRVFSIGTTPLLVADNAIVSAASVGDGVAVAAAEPLLEQDGIWLRASSWDDVQFVSEVLLKKTYNLISARETCCIDVGMNVGLASLAFAKMPNVCSVHAFEPFPSTYERALANIALNPELAKKITTHNVGLAARDETLTVMVNGGTEISGSMSLFNRSGGEAVLLAIRDAAAVLGPIITSARAQGQQVIAKIDCEGSEFDIFQSLAAADLFRYIDALAVEWHRVFPGRDQAELTRPLLDAGFVVLDISPDEGNGFFYAMRTPSLASDQAAGAPVAERPGVLAGLWAKVRR